MQPLSFRCGDCCVGDETLHTMGINSTASAIKSELAGQAGVSLGRVVCPLHVVLTATNRTSRRTCADRGSLRVRSGPGAASLSPPCHDGQACLDTKYHDWCT